jgi:hypothetical protein
LEKMLGRVHSYNIGLKRQGTSRKESLHVFNHLKLLG